MRLSHSRSAFWHVSIVAALLFFSSTPSSRLAAQYFPNTQPINYNPYGGGPYGNTVAGWGAGARLNLSALSAAYSQQLPAAGSGYNVIQPFNSYSYGGGYRTNPYNYSYSPYGYGR